MQNDIIKRLDIYRQVKDFFALTRNAIDELDRDPFLVESLSKAMEIICSNNGKLITSGLGKAGSAAEKAASSFSSLGIPACYLHPAQASHGDAGIIQHEDTMIAFSNSGKTREVIETIGMFRKLSQGKVIAITSHPDSPVRELSDMVIDIGVIKEAGYLSIAPTTSVIMMLVVSDMLATLCAWKIGTTLEEYAIRHHSGYTGSVARGDGIIQ